MNNYMNENTKVTKDVEVVENVEETKDVEVTEVTKEMDTTDVKKGDVNNIGETTVVKMKYADISKSVIRLIRLKVKEYVNETYKQYFDGYKVKVKITNTSKRLCERCSKLKEEGINSVPKASMGIFCASCEPTIDDNGRVTMNNLTILIVRDVMINSIMVNLLSADLVINRILDKDIRHEVGHLIDYISYNGMSEEEYKKMRECDKEEFSNFGDRWDKNINEISNDLPEEEDNMFISSLAFAKTYHTTGAERKADENVGLSWKDFYETTILIHEANKKRKSITFELE